MQSVIRSKLDDNLVLHMNDVPGENLTVGEFHPDEKSQRWEVSGRIIRHRDNENLVLDIADCCEEEGASICAWEYNEGANQHWSINHLPPKRFFIISRMHGKVVDVKRESESEGAKVIMFEKKGGEPANQLWYEGKHGDIFSCLNDFAPDDSGDYLTMREHDVEVPSVRWVKSGKRVCRQDDFEKVWDIKKSRTWNRVKVLTYKYHGGDNQSW